MSSNVSMGILLTVIMVDSRNVDHQRGIRPAGVEDRHFLRMMRYESGWGNDERPSVG